MLRTRMTASLLFMAAVCHGQIMEQARRIQAGVLGIDSHNDTAQRLLIENVDICLAALASRRDDRLEDSRDRSHPDGWHRVAAVFGDTNL